MKPILSEARSVNIAAIRLDTVQQHNETALFYSEIMKL